MTCRSAVATTDGVRRRFSLLKLRYCLLKLQVILIIANVIGV